MILKEILQLKKFKIYLKISRLLYQLKEEEELNVLIMMMKLEN